MATFFKLDVDLFNKIDFSLNMTRIWEITVGLLAFSGIYVMWISLHYAAAHLYTTYCVPGTILGFLLSPFTAVLPHCEGLRWLIYYGGNSIIAMWIVLGFWLSKKLVPIKAE
jgi:hypothetical protein